MESLEDLYRQLEDLPKGSIVTKTIAGKRYFYLQYKQDGKVKSVYVKSRDVDVVKRKADLRKYVQSLIAEIEGESPPLARCDKNLGGLSGHVMLMDEEVASFESGKLVWVDESRAPLALKRTGSLLAWLSSRTADDSRPNVRKLKIHLGAEGKDGVSISLINRSRTLTDGYWFKPKRSKTKFKDVAFNSDAFFSMALNGKLTNPDAKASLTPELTSLGSYEKGWKIIDGEWWLYKKGNPMELFSEWFASELAVAIGVPSVFYVVEGDTIRSKNFATYYNLELMSGLTGEDDTYQKVFKALSAYGEEICRQYLLLMWFDCLVYNVDRHTENMGLLRDPMSGAVVSLAPNFDDNMCLLAALAELPEQRNHDGMINLFRSYLSSSEKPASIYRGMKLPDFDESLILKILEGSKFKIDKQRIVRFLLEGKAVLAKLQREI